MTDVLVRDFAPELSIRSAAKGGDGRTVEGIAVPYGQRQRIDDDLIESFARGCFAHQIRAAHRVHFARDHLAHGGTLIGKTVELRDDAAGLWGAWRVSKTPVGEETLTLVADGVLDQLSVGFRSRKDRRDPDGTIVREKADLVEVAVVLQGAYGEGALISGVRERGAHVCDVCGGSGLRGHVLTSTPSGTWDVTDNRVSVSTPNRDAARQILAQLPPV
jgi:HK97 family phage prohead protease